MMKPDAAGDAGSNGPEQHRTDEDSQDISSAGEASEVEDEDDGSVPDKQIHRWKNEGGAVRPTD